MKFPVEWIREFVEIRLDPAALGAKLTSVGFVVDTVEGAGDAAVLDVDVPPNRPDAMNMYGLAREVAAFSGASLSPYPAELREAAGSPGASARASVAIEAPDLCARYCARVVRSVRIGPSPEWIVRRLAAVGLASVNNVVDVTNYVLWDLGQPLHAFDLSLLEGRRIVVRRARRGESLTTLDGVPRPLDAGTLVIADAARPVAIAGVMGGAGTMISPATTEVLLESAWFEPKSVRRTSKRLGLSTDASYRFERGADVEAARAAIDRAASLLAQVAGGEVLPGLIDVRSAEAPARRRLRLRSRRLGTLLGMPVDPSRAGAALTSLGFEVAKAADGLEVTVPAHRQDVGGEADLVEEVARSIGYDAIPETIPHLPGTGAVNRFAHRREETLRSSLLASGFSEAITYAFVGRDLDGLLGEEGIAAVALANPMAEGQDALRSTLLPGLALAVRHNLNHGVRDVHLFEVGRVFRRADTTVEILMAGLAVTGLARPRHWSEPSREAGLHDLKGAIEEALARLSLPATIEPLHGASPFRPGTAARILAGGRGAGRMGILSQAAAERLGIKAPVALAEIDLTRLFAAEERPMTFRPLPRFPSASRALALVVRRGTAWRDLERAILDAGGDLVARVTVFDRYEGTSLPEGHVSLAVSIVYQHPDRTLGAAEVQAAESKVLASLGSRFGVTLRA